jgi:hypothetical protein
MDAIDWEVLTAMVGLFLFFAGCAVDAVRHPERWSR